jgi:hypothetical protein
MTIVIFKSAEYVILDLPAEEIGKTEELSEKIKRSGALETSISLLCQRGKCRLRKVGGNSHMTASIARQILHEVIEAHGGMEYWNMLEAIEVEISACGFLFTAKQRPVLRHVRMKAATRKPNFTFFDFPNPGQTAELSGNDEVRIRDGNGAVVARRENPRAAFRGLRRQLAWDDLDFIYFAGYATWNYLTAPFLLAREGMVTEMLDQTPDGLLRIQAIFPGDIPTHCRKQVFYFDDSRLLRRLDYTAEVVGRWAHAAHFCYDYRTFGKLRVPVRRRVLPIFFSDRPLPWPTLVALEVHSVRPI